MKEIASELVLQIQKLYNNHKKVFEINVKGEYSLLLYLFKHLKSEITPGNISDDFNISTARVATSLNSLEAKGYLTREISKSDRRVIIIKLTKEGTEKAIKLKEKQINYISKILNHFKEEEINDIMKLINKLDEVLKNKEENEGNCNVKTN